MNATNSSSTLSLEDIIKAAGVIKALEPRPVVCQGDGIHWIALKGRIFATPDYVEALRAMVKVEVRKMPSLISGMEVRAVGHCALAAAVALMRAGRLDAAMSILLSTRTTAATPPLKQAA